MDSGAGELLLQALHKTPEDVPLNLSSGVLGLAGLIETSDIANAYGMGVVAGAVGSNHFEGTALLVGPVKTDHIVVAYHLEASLPVPAVNVLYGEVLTFDSGLLSIIGNTSSLYTRAQVLSTQQLQG